MFVSFLSLAVGCGRAPAEPVVVTAAEPFGPDPAITAMCQAGCAAEVAFDESDVVTQPDAEVGDLARCPVSGVVFQVRDGQPNVVIGDHTWYTCCEMCRGKLTANPGRFVRL